MEFDEIDQLIDFDMVTEVFNLCLMAGEYTEENIVTTGYGLLPKDKISHLDREAVLKALALILPPLMW
ncbi:hypothetical protein [Photobacterium leiognathi]|uniref:hypothetical protein n=1 Tax=Photobacterium leiognathi TaxID=553611 RepID=UPI002980E531|nr:hypothetical protein [Photobacterium leiognathi]